MTDKTERGFSIYGKFQDTYGSTIRVQESSAAGSLKVWIFCKGGATAKHKEDEVTTPHLNLEQMKSLKSALDEAIKDAESPENWRNDPEYIKIWGNDEDS